MGNVCRKTEERTDEDVSLHISALSEAVQQSYGRFASATKNRKQFGLEFGKSCYALKQAFGAQGHRNDLTSGEAAGSGYYAKLDEGKVPHGTARSWVRHYKKQCALGLNADDMPTQLPFWERFCQALERITPSWSDGVEHRFVVLMEQSLIEPATTKQDVIHKNLCIKILRQAADLFSKHAKILEKSN